jgi:hypothetical protein
LSTFLHLLEVGPEHLPQPVKGGFELAQGPWRSPGGFAGEFRERLRLSDLPMKISL